jgi:hypothetical protein
MDVGRSTGSLGKVSILHSTQELAMTQRSYHVSLMRGITNSSVEVASWSDGSWIFSTSKTPRRGLGVKM